jgi:hypothetical protein
MKAFHFSRPWQASDPIYGHLHRYQALTHLHAHAKSQFGGLKAEDAKKLKHLEKQNLALKKLLAEAELEKAVL